MITYITIFILLLIAELFYFCIADKCNIIDKPNERSSHSTIVLRGGGIIFLIGAWIWSLFFGFQYPWFLAGLTLVAGVSFIDDIHSLPDSVRLVVQFAAAAMAFYQLGILHWSMWWIILLALIVYVGATNVINFMDGINGITAGYSLAVLIPLVLLNRDMGFVEQSLIILTILASLVFCIFNFRPKGEMFCRRCRFYRYCLYHVVLVRKCDNQDRRYYLADILVSIWCGWLFDHCPSYYVTRGLGRGTS